MFLYYRNFIYFFIFILSIITINVFSFYSDGTLDEVFNSMSGPNNNVNSIYILDDQKILIGGDFSEYDGVPRNRVVRLNPDGSVDMTFDSEVGANGTSVVLRNFLVQDDGKIIIVGNFTEYDGVPRSRVARLNPDGSLDTTFDPGTGANALVQHSILQPDGKIIIMGNFTQFDGVSRNRIARLDLDGSLDTTFDPGTGANGTINYTDLYNDGKLIIVGNFSSFNGVSRNRIARLNPDGSVDTTFNPGLTAQDNFMSYVKILPDEKLYIAGTFTIYAGVPRNRIARLNPDGTLDTTFDPGTGADVTVWRILHQDDDKLIIVGNFTEYDGVSRNRIARLNSDGSLDTTFDPGTGANNWILAAKAKDDGSILVGGWFTEFDGVARSRVARLSEFLTVRFLDFDGTVLDTQQVIKGYDAIAPVGLMRTGYNFIGWLPEVLSSISDDVDFIAQWAPITYEIEFDANGGSGSMPNQIFAYDTLANLNTNSFIRAGWDFVGWNTVADGSGDTYLNGSVIENLSSSQDEVITLYAQWQVFPTGGVSRGGSGVTNVDTRPVFISDEVEMEIDIKESEECLNFEIDENIEYGDQVFKNYYLVDQSGNKQYLFSGYEVISTDGKGFDLALDKKITRLEVAKMLMIAGCLEVRDYKSFDLTVDGRDIKDFKDLPRGEGEDVDREWINIAYSALYYGLIDGTDDGNAEIEREINIAELAKMLSRSERNFEDKKYEFSNLYLQSLDRSQWYMVYFANLNAIGKYNSFVDGIKDVSGGITRGEFLEMILNTLK